jgi:formylmethanofuran dehydrogenase subunit E
MIIHGEKYEDYRCEKCKEITEAHGPKDEPFPKAVVCRVCGGVAYRAWGSTTVIPPAFQAVRKDG